ncbi:protein hook isoform X2 [Drosophila navojoa]|uniref:protein hook isoform X1 n=1 Tax=Drosophila navojoa TaxID=7232 RepID=UPI0011BD4781|nr:protein hook isoform X1 [Drosophila navojoa]XP_030242700.1 protein hook isoform X2 [Drosophila navojoa]
MSAQNGTYYSLLEWFKTLNLNAPHANAEELSDGVALAQALNQFAPESFTNSWLSKIKSSAVGSNWRLRMSNLKKVVEGVYEYYSDVLNYTLQPDFVKPDVQAIAEKCDLTELERLLQLVLGCAVNCAKKQSYICEIMCLEEELQANIMRALQELESSTRQSVEGGGVVSSMSRNSLSNMLEGNTKAQEERDAMAQKCFETEKKMLLLIDEKNNLQQELQKIQQEFARLELNTIGDDGVSLGPIQAGSVRYNELRRQLELVKEELLQSEGAREDLKIKAQQQEADILHMQQRIDELMKTTAELTSLKDEVDVLRESTEKLKVCEAQLETYKKKLEEYNDLKKHVKMLEERSADYVQQNAQFEEDAKRYANTKGQIELFKKEIQDLHTKLDNESSKNVKLEFDNKNLESKVLALQREKDSLLKERDNLREAFDELKCGQLSTNSGSLTGNTVSRELQPAAMVDKIQRLEAENKALREGQGGQTALAQLLDDANKRCEHLREQMKAANERILSLTHASQSDDPILKENELSKQIKQLMELNEQKTLQIEESSTQNSAMQCKITQLESTLSTREQELMAYEVKYRKCLEKAKEVIKTIEPRIASGLEASILEKSIDVIEEESKTKMSTMEEQLMTSAYYRLGVNAHRDAVESKLALLMGSGQTFLARQRQSAPRKSLTTMKSK